MGHIKLNKKTVDNIQPPASLNGKPTQVFYRDSDLTGFGLKVTNAGSKVYIIETRINGKSKRITLGKHGQLTTEQARRQAQIMLGEIAQGNDPVAEKQNKRVQAVTLLECYQDYLKIRHNLKENTLHDYKRCIEGALEDWLDKPLTAITKDMVEQRHQKLGKKSAARANNTMRVLRALFNFALERYEDNKGKAVIQVNPVNRLSKTRGWYEVKRRQTLLTPTQLRPWFEATHKLNNEVTRDYLHFLLFTGLRRSEASRMTWDDVDFNEKVFLIPETKNNEPHRLPMSVFLEELLRRRYLQAEKKWVFPSPVTDGPLKEPRTALAKITSESGIEFTLHDLRRTFITIAESLDIPAYALKRLLNHKFSNDVTAGYIVPNTERLRVPMQNITNYINKQIQG